MSCPAWRTPASLSQCPSANPPRAAMACWSPRERVLRERLRRSTASLPGRTVTREDQRVRPRDRRAYTAPPATRSRAGGAPQAIRRRHWHNMTRAARSTFPRGPSTAGSWALAAPKARSEEGANACAASGISAASSARSARESGRRSIVAGVYSATSSVCTYKGVSQDERKRSAQTETPSDHGPPSSRKNHEIRPSNGSWASAQTLMLPV